MIIAYLTNQYARASDTFIRSEVKQLRATGHTVHTYSVRRPADDQLVSDEVRHERAGTHYILEQGVTHLVLSFLREFFSHPGRTLGAARLAWMTRQHGIDRVFRQVAYFFEACHLARQLRSAGVEHLHNHFADNSATVAMLTSHIGGVPYSTQVHGPHIFYAPAAWALGEKIQRSAFTSCISHFCRSQCMAFTPAEAWGRIHIVHCGLDANFLESEASPIPDAPNLVCVGRLSKEKGNLVLLEAVRRLAADGIAVKVTLVGDGPMRQSIEAFIQQHRLDGQVRLLGWRDSEGVRQEISRARALVLTSFSEGLPVVIMEAMALGRPAIATTIAGVPELVQHGVNGWLIPPGSIEDLTAAMHEAVTTPRDKLAAMGRAAADQIRAAHDIRKEVAVLEQLIAASVTGSVETLVCDDSNRIPLTLVNVPAEPADER